MRKVTGNILLIRCSLVPQTIKSLEHFPVMVNVMNKGGSVQQLNEDTDGKLLVLPTITEIPKVLKRPGPPKSSEPGLTSSKTFGIFVAFGNCNLFNCLASGGAGLFENLWDLVISVFLEMCDGLAFRWGWPKIQDT